MTLGNVLQDAIKKDLASNEVNNELVYTELVKDGKLEIKLTSKHEEGMIECSIPFTGNEQDENYLRYYFLSMVCNAAVHGMKRLKHKKRKR